MTAEVLLFGKHEHYVKSDGVRTYVGQVRHRASKEVLRARGVGRGIMLVVSKKHREAAIANSNDTTEIIPMQTRPQTLEDSTHIMQAIPPVSFTPQEPEPEPRSRWQRMREKLYDREWHVTSRRTAGTVLIWAFTVSSCIVFGKGLLWILSL